MGGSLSLSSTPNQGSTFTLEIPLDQAQESEVRVLEEEPGRIVGLVPGQPEYRILIVEDQIENSMLLHRILAEVGLTTKVAKNGIEGMELFQKWKPQLILMDIRMPIMDGLEATRQIRKLEGGDKVKIVAITASVFEDERDRVMIAGMNDFLRKPYRPEEIFSCLTSNLGIGFVVEETSHEDNPNANSILIQDDFGILPKEDREDLTSALIAMDAERIATIIDRIKVLYPKMGNALAVHAKNLEYTMMLRSLGESGN
jgi:CheY-like chemotaxis protein